MTQLGFDFSALPPEPEQAPDVSEDFDPWAKWPVNVDAPDPTIVDAVQKSIDDAYSAGRRGAGIFGYAVKLWRLTLDRYRPDAEEEYLEVVGRIGADATRALAPGFAALMQHFYVCGGFADVLGVVYQNISSNWGRSALGQFFTPWPLCLLMAQLNLDEAVGERLAAGETITVHEPCVGSGTLLLAMRAAVAKRWGRRASGRMRLTGMDLDPVCVDMAAVQLRLADERFMHSFMLGNAFELRHQQQEASPP